MPVMVLNVGHTNRCVELVEGRHLSSVVVVLVVGRSDEGLDGVVGHEVFVGQRKVRAGTRAVTAQPAHDGRPLCTASE